MANSDRKGRNRYLASSSTEEKSLDINKLLLDIMKDEYPDDKLYSNNTLTPESPSKQTRQAFMTDEQIADKKELVAAKRNRQNVLNVATGRDEYESYDIAKTIPTIDEDELDELIDEEWEFFEDPDDAAPVVVVPPKPTGLFLVNSETDLFDYHDLYIQAGPQTLDPDGPDVTDRIFCVFYIEDGVARPVPTYKTLEVMLVERGLTYGAISEATPDQIKEFDLILDGEVDGDEDLTPYDEFVERTMPLRDSDWDINIRFRSGYRPKAPFVRDPGDYIKPQDIRGEGDDQFQDEDPNDFYFDRVFQKQTYKESLREKYEGRMVVADWPAPDYDGGLVGNAPGVAADDAVRNTRIMTNGHWKFFRDGRVFKLYAYNNDLDISEYAQGSGRYGARGYIQLIIDAGGAKVIQPNGGTDGINDVQTGNSDLRPGGSDPLWNGFPHIVEADELDYAEYQSYLDNFTNGGDPFGIEALQPFEPPGSIKYYDAARYSELVAQAAAQEQIEVIKDQIFEILPGLASTVHGLKTQFDAYPKNMSSYVETHLGENSPLYNVWISNEGKWKYVKKKSKKLKTKKTEGALFRMVKKTARIKANLDESEERRLVSDHKWMKTVARDKFAAWASGGPQAGINPAAVASPEGPGAAIADAINAATGTVQDKISAIPALPNTNNAAGFAIANGALQVALIISNPIALGAAAIVGLGAITNALVGEVAPDEYDLPPWRFMDDNWYLKACIYNEVDGYLEGFSRAASAADGYLNLVVPAVNELFEQIKELDQAIINATSVEEFTTIYEFMTAIQDLANELTVGSAIKETLRLPIEVDAYLANQLKRQYKAIQYLRKKVHNKVGNKQKFGIAWPDGPQKILNRYVPGCKFDNFLPSE